MTCSVAEGSPGGIALFTGASALCGLAQSELWLVAARFVQGIGGAMTSAVILGMIVTIFPEPREQAKAIGVYAFVASAGGAVGLLAGGLITQAIDWHWIFFVNLPIGLADLIFARRSGRRAGHRPAHRRRPAGRRADHGRLMLGVYTIVKPRPRKDTSMVERTSTGVSMITGRFDSDPSSPIGVVERAPFELRVGPFVDYELDVVSFRGQERTSDVYVYEVTFVSSEAEDTLNTSLFGQPACLTIKVAGRVPRVIQGIAVSVEGLGGVPAEQQTGKRRYRVEIVPKLWLMKQRRKNRVFQQKSAVDIVRLMLKEVGIAPDEVKWRAPAGDYPPLPFVYQRNESDFDFFRRVLSDAGLFFYFVHASGLLPDLMPKKGSGGANVQKGQTVVNFAALGSNTPAVRDEDSPEGDAATLHFDDGMGTADHDEGVFDFGLKKTVASKALRMHERDVEAAKTWVAELTAPKSDGDPDAVPFDVDDSPMKPDDLRQERYQVDPSLIESGKAGQLEGPRMALELARLRRGFIEAQGASDCRRMGAGYRFKLADHPIKALNGEYTVVELEAEGVNPYHTKETTHVYRNHIRCIPSTHAPVPPRPKERPKLGLELAQVVAYSDIKKGTLLESSPHGYVKIRFQWDIVDRFGTSAAMLKPGAPRESGTEDDCALWVPVMQPSAGPGYGMQVIPREGMDMIVGFLEGHGERPVILGCFYSATSPLPWPDPIDSQKMGLRTESRPAHPGAYSEISVNDHLAHEVVTVRAQRDLSVNVLANSSTSVGGNSTLSVTGTATTTVDKTDTVTVKKKATRTFHDGRETNVDGADEVLTVTGVNMVTKVHGEYNITADKQLHVTQNADSLLMKDHFELKSAGSITLSNDACSIELKDGKITLKAASELDLVCGGSKVTLKSDGTVEIGGSTKASVGGGTGKVELTAAGAKASGPKVEISGASLTEITGALVKIN